MTYCRQLSGKLPIVSEQWNAQVRNFGLQACNVGEKETVLQRFFKFLNIIAFLAVFM